MNHGIVQINQETLLLDLCLFGIREIGALYLIKGEKTCLIDSGMKKEAGKIVKVLDSLSLFPDILILTHSHFDHSQGAPFLRREALKRGIDLKIMASEKALKNLSDQSWNSELSKGKFENILNVTPVKDGETLDLKSTELKFYDLCGHCADDLGIFDIKNKTLFTGDSLGYLIQELIIPPFMPPFWDEASFKRTISKVKTLNHEKICFAHYGSIDGATAKNYPDRIEETVRNWWRLFSEIDSMGKIDDINYVIDSIKTNLDIKLPDLEPDSIIIKSLLYTFNLFNIITGKERIRVCDLQIKAVVNWLIHGYKRSNAK